MNSSTTHNIVLIYLLRRQAIDRGCSREVCVSVQSTPKNYLISRPSLVLRFICPGMLYVEVFPSEGAEGIIKILSTSQLFAPCRWSDAEWQVW